ncbi:MAG: outer membrane beta-barrel protein [Ignavibacteriaceae bacterium]|nr:outer membrane beta-barrel protein [Ignavibacteriaceae bacterium]
MKKILIILLFILFDVVEAQESKPFSNFDIGFYGGFNFYNIDNIRGNFLVELKTNLISSFKLKASTGYFRTIQPYSNTNTVRKYSENTIDTLPKFFASKYNLLSKNYDIFPITLGIQYNFYQSIFSPYLLIELAYNFINASIETSPPEVWSYNSIDEIPDEFKENQKDEKLPDNSYGIILGAGTSYHISSKLNLDIRYSFRYDNEIFNTHHFIVGIYF